MTHDCSICARPAVAYGCHDGAQAAGLFVCTAHRKTADDGTRVVTELPLSEAGG